MVPPFLGVCACCASATPAPQTANAAASQTSFRMIAPLLNIPLGRHSIVPDPSVQEECRHATQRRRWRIGRVSLICCRPIPILGNTYHLAVIGRTTMTPPCKRNADEQVAQLSAGCDRRSRCRGRSRLEPLVRRGAFARRARLSGRVVRKALPLLRRDLRKRPRAEPAHH